MNARPIQTLPLTPLAAVTMLVALGLVHPSPLWAQTPEAGSDLLAHSKLDPTASGPIVVIGATGLGGPKAPNIDASGYPTIAIPFASGSLLHPNVTYWSPAGFRPLTMDIYTPPPSLPKPASGFPMLMFIHGGGWSAGSAQSSAPIADFPRLLADIAATGYVVTSVNYRLNGEAKWPAQGQDIKAAIRFLRSSARDYGIDPQRFATWGVSAGAQLSATAATTCGLTELQPDNQLLPNLPPAAPVTSPDGRVDNDDCVQAAVAWYGTYDLSTLTEQARLAGAMSREVPTAPEWRLLGCMGEGCAQNKIASASAIQTLTKEAPPMLLISGSDDKIVPSTQTLEFSGALAAEGIPHDVMIIEGVGHNFVGKDAFATQIATQSALDRMLAFLALHLKPTPTK